MEKHSTHSPLHSDHTTNREERSDREKRNDREERRESNKEERSQRSSSPVSKRRKYSSQNVALHSKEEKRKLLWGNKEKDLSQTNWSKVPFEDEKQRAKFLALMGAKKKERYDPLNPTGSDSEGEEEKDKEGLKDEKERSITTGGNASGNGSGSGSGHDGEDEVTERFQRLEKQYYDAVQRKDNRRSGLQ